MDKAPCAHHLCWRHWGEVFGDLRFHLQSLPAVSLASGSHMHNPSLSIRSTAQHRQACCAVLGYSLA